MGDGNVSSRECWGLLNYVKLKPFGFSFKPLCLSNKTRCSYGLSLWEGGAGEEGWGMGR